MISRFILRQTNFALFLISLIVIVLYFAFRSQKKSDNFEISSTFYECWLDRDIPITHLKKQCKWHKKQQKVFWTAKKLPYLWLRAKVEQQNLNNPYLSLTAMTKFTVFNERGEVLYESHGENGENIVSKSYLVPLPRSSLTENLYLKVTSRSDINIGVMGKVYLGDLAPVLKQLVCENAWLLLSAFFYLVLAVLGVCLYFLLPFRQAHLLLISFIFFFLNIESLNYADAGLLKLLINWEGFPFLTFYPSRYLLAASMFYYISLVAPERSGKLIRYLQLLALLNCTFFVVTTMSVYVLNLALTDAFNYSFAIFNVGIFLISAPFLYNLYRHLSDRFSRVLFFTSFFILIIRFLHGLGLLLDLFVVNRCLVGFVFAVFLLWILTEKIRLDQTKIYKYLELEKMLGLTQTMMQSVAHDLKQPFAKFTMMMDLVKNTDSLSDRKQTVLTLGPLVEKSNNYVQKILDDILSLNDRNSMKLGDCNPLELIQEAINYSVSFNVEKKLYFNYSIRHQSCLVGDREKIIRVITNLIKNAQEAAPHNGKITISTKDLYSNDNSYIEISIHNSGSYIDSDFVEHIFEPFISKKSSNSGRQGTGLGLYISKNIAAAHNGSLVVESDINTGTVFKFRCPTGGKIKRKSAIELPQHNQYSFDELIALANTS